MLCGAFSGDSPLFQSLRRFDMFACPVCCSPLDPTLLNAHRLRFLFSAPAPPPSPQPLPLLSGQVVSELRTCLVTGYQLHVRTFTLHTVLKAVADSYSPPNPPSVDVRPTTATPSPSSAPAAAAVDTAAGCTLPIADAAVAMDVDEEDRSVTASAAAASTGAGCVSVAAKVVPAVPSSLVKPPFDACIPEIAELLMEDLFGESAAAKEVSEILFFLFYFRLCHLDLNMPGDTALFSDGDKALPKIYSSFLGCFGRGFL